MDATTLGLIIGLVIAVAALIAVGLKLYLVAQSAVNKLPANSTQQQQITAALNAVLAYLQANPQLDKAILQDILTIITIFGELTGVDMSSYITDIKKLMTADASKTTG